MAGTTVRSYPGLVGCPGSATYPMELVVDLRGRSQEYINGRLNAELKGGFISVAEARHIAAMYLPKNWSPFSQFPPTEDVEVVCEKPGYNAKITLKKLECPQCGREPAPEHVTKAESHDRLDCRCWNCTVKWSVDAETL